MPGDASEWNYYYYFYGDKQLCMVSFHEPACEPKNQRPGSGRRFIAHAAITEIAPSGMPTPAAFERMKTIEERLIELLAYWKVESWLVGRQTYGGLRELLFQVDAPYLAGFEDACRAVAGEYEGTELLPSEGWEYFNRNIAPDEDARGHINNRRVLEALKDNGSDFSQAHVLDHTFLGAADALEEVRRALVERASYRETQRSEEHIVLSSSKMLEQDAIDKTTRLMRGLAKRYGVTYDGWGTALIKSR
jgi:regulator of RNase E activity RraB